jgi:hypothetical protein
VRIPPSTTVVTSRSGPDGVVVVDNGSTVTLYAGDGNSTLRSFDVTNPSNPIAGGTVNTGGGAFRVDEMAYSPLTKQLFVANNANSPAFASLIDTSTALAPTLTRSPVLVPGQTPFGAWSNPSGIRSRGLSSCPSQLHRHRCRWGAGIRHERQRAADLTSRAWESPDAALPD